MLFTITTWEFEINVVSCTKLCERHNQIKVTVRRPRILKIANVYVDELLLAFCTTIATTQSWFFRVLYVINMFSSCSENVLLRAQYGTKLVQNLYLKTTKNNVQINSVEKSVICDLCRFLKTSKLGFTLNANISSFVVEFVQNCMFQEILPNYNLMRTRLNFTEKFGLNRTGRDLS